LKAVAAPQDKEALRNVKTVDKRIRLAVEALIGDTATPEAQLASIARQLVAHVDSLTDGVRDGGDSVDAPTMAGVEGALVKRLALAAERVKPHDAAVARQLLRAVQDVNELTPFHLGSVRDVIADPEKKEHQQKLTSDTQALKDAVMAVVAAANSSHEEELLAHRRLARDALQEGSGKAFRGEVAESSGREATEGYGRVERHAREAVLSAAGKSLLVDRAAAEVRSAADGADGVLQDVAADGGAPESCARNDQLAHATDAASDTIARDLAARMKGEARKLQRDLQAVASALQRGEPKEVAARLRAAGERFGELAQLAEAEAKSRGGDEEKQMLDVVALLKDGIPALSDAAIAAMGASWDGDLTSDAVDQGTRLAALAGSLADGSFANELGAATKVPKDDCRGQRLFNVASPDFVGRDELTAADELEKMLPALSKNNLPEQTLVNAEKLAGLLGRSEPSSIERLAMAVCLADADLQHVLDLAADNKDAPAKLGERTVETVRGLPRNVEALLQDLLSADHQQSVKKAAQAAEQSVPRAIEAAKKRDAGAMKTEGNRGHLALDALAESFAPSADLSLLELRERTGSALEGLTKPGNTKFVEVEKLAAMRLPLLRALGVALRRADKKELAPKAEELARVWASLPEKARAGDAVDVTEAGGRMEELLDELMKGTGASPFALSERIDADLSRLQNAVHDGDQVTAQSLAQGIVSDLKVEQKSKYFDYLTGKRILRALAAATIW
jgi:hypothetical protein